MRRRTTQTNAGAAAGLEAAVEARWQARPGLAGTIRLIALCGPVGVSLAVVYGASRVLGPPAGSLALYIAWWAGLSAAATISLVGVARLSRRLLPLAALMRLSLVFPDGAPSRFRIALRTGTVTTLEERLADARRGEPSRTPVQAARLLLELVAHLDDHDPLTRGHSERVRAYAQSIGRELRLDRRELDLLNWAALLHDIGKLEVPHEILAKKGRPTEEEWEVLRGHPSAGAQLAAPLSPWLGEWSAAIEEHHERWDGAGYPRGLAGDEISLAGRIVAVADVFDVITSSRSYKQSGSVLEARQELSRCAGTQFDPDVVRAFLAISVRQGRLAAPLSWLAHAAVLARVPVTQATSGLSAGAAAVAVGAGLGVGVAAHPSGHVTPPVGAMRAVAPAPVVTRPAVPPVPRPADASSAPKKSSVTKKAKVHAAKRRARHDPAPAPRAEREPVEESASSAVATEPAPSRPPQAPAASASRPRSASPSPAKPPPAPQPTPSLPPALKQAGGALPKAALSDLTPAIDPPGTPAPPPPSVPPLTGGEGSLTESLTSLTEDLTGDLGAITDDVTSLTDDVVAVTDPDSPLTDDVASVVDDVSSLTGDVTSLLTPPPAHAPPAPPDDPPDEESPSLVKGLLSALGT